ncbi:MAG: histidinol-phosphate aminotransferase [Micromonosporaceae bacterium]|jgi:histidinol-phosphate aminotransferase|nr:histidinol-phosphate aminotransferase [Micromonosporaceae bacterium]
MTDAAAVLVRRDDVDDLSMNETPYPPLPAIQALIERGATSVHRYPDHASRDLIAALAARLAVDETHLLVGPGSAGLCQHVLQALGGVGSPGRTEVVLPDPSFEAYPLLVMNAGARPVMVATRDYRHDLAAMLAAVGPATRAVLLCVPNNPTGAVLHEDEVTAFLDQIPPDVTVIIDEAYHEFVVDPRVPDGVALHRRYPNVCVLRTFSKAYGLAALRVGYAVAAPPTVAATRMVGQVFFPGALGQAAAVACLTEPAETELRDRCVALASARTALADALLATDLLLVPSEANFLWLPVRGRAVALADHLRAANILVRAYPDLGVRITIGSPAANERLLAAVADFPAADFPAAEFPTDVTPSCGS